MTAVSGVRVLMVAAGDSHTILLSSDGVRTCGSGRHGELGHGSCDCELVPKKIIDFQV